MRYTDRGVTTSQNAVSGLRDEAGLELINTVGSWAPQLLPSGRQFARNARFLNWCGPVFGKRSQSQILCAERTTFRMLGMDYGLRSAPTMATAIAHFSKDRLCQAWRVPF